MNMNSKRHGTTPYPAAFMLMAVTLLAACSGGGGSTPPPPTPPPPTPTGSYLFYQAGTDGLLMAVDPVNPENPLQVAAAPVKSSAIAAIGDGTFIASANAVDDLHTRTIIYAQGGMLWRVSALKANGLAITQVSSESAATNICRTQTASNLKNHDDAAYVYELAGADDDCNTAGDNLWRMVRVGTNSSTAPFNAKQPLTSIDESTTGAHKGWLVDEKPLLKFCNANFSSCQSVINAPSYASIMYYGPINISQELLRLEDAIGTYTVETNAWKTRATVTTNYPDTHFVRDNGYLYYADYAASTMSIYRDRVVDDSATEQLSGTPGFDPAQHELTLKKTSNRVIAAIHLKGSNQSQVVAIDPANKTTSSLTGGGVPGNIRSLLTSGDRLYYSFDQETAYLTDGTTETYTEDNPPTPNLSSRDSFTSSSSAWLGARQPRQFRIGNTLQPQTVFLTTGFNAATGFAGGSIIQYDAVTAAKGSVLGAIPAGIKEVHIEGNQSITLAKGLRDDGGSDIFFVDLDTPNSLRRITSDTTGDIIIDTYR